MLNALQHWNDGLLVIVHLCHISLAERDNLKGILHTFITFGSSACVCSPAVGADEASCSIWCQITAY